MSKAAGNERRKGAETRAFEASEKELICGSGECRFSKAEADCVNIHTLLYIR